MKGRPPAYELPRRGAATDSEVEDRALKMLRKKHEQEYRDTPESDWPKLDKRHRQEMEDVLDTGSPLHDNPRSPK